MIGSDGAVGPARQAAICGLAVRVLELTRLQSPMRAGLLGRHYERLSITLHRFLAHQTLSKRAVKGPTVQLHEARAIYRPDWVQVGLATPPKRY